jgi:protein-disulfide isomerase
VPMFLHDKSAVASRLGSSPAVTRAGGEGSTMGVMAGGALGQYGSASLSRDTLSGDEKVKLFEAEQAYYNALEEVLVQRYIKTFFDDFGKKNNINDPGAAQAKYFEGKVVVADAEVDKFLEENKENPGLQKIPEGERKPQIRSYLENRSRQGAMRELVDQAKSSGKIQVAMAKPVEPKLEVTDGGNVALGNPNAPISIVEFADFQCPFCARMVPTIKEVLKKYDGKVKWVYRDFPLREIHPEALPSAVVATCAGKQGKYWDMHHKLFENYQTLGDALYTKLAGEMGLDSAKFEECRKDPAMTQEALNDMADGNKLGVQGTPTYFVNGRKAPGDMRELSRLIDEELAKL